MHEALERNGVEAVVTYSSFCLDKLRKPQKLLGYSLFRSRPEPGTFQTYHLYYEVTCSVIFSWV